MATSSGFVGFSIVVVKPAIHRAQELGDGEAEGVGEFFDVVDGDIRFALFDLADVGAVKARFEAEGLLRPAAVKAQEPQVLRQYPSGLAGHD